jgi:hypothetical protein
MTCGAIFGQPALQEATPDAAWLGAMLDRRRAAPEPAGP